MYVFGDFLPMRTLCDVYHKEFESHQHSILDISEFMCIPTSKLLLQYFYSLTRTDHTHYEQINLYNVKDTAEYIIAN